MPGIVICELDLTKLVLKEYDPKVITEIGKCPVKLTLDGKEILDVVDEDPLLQQEMVDAGQESLEKSAKAISKELEGFDKDAAKVIQKSGLAMDGKPFAKSFEGVYSKAADAASEEANLAVEKVWDAYVKTHKDYRNYKIKLGAKVALSGVGIGVGVASAVAGVAAVATLPAAIVGIVGAARSLSEMLQTIGTAIKSAQTVYQGLDKDIKELTAEYNYFSKASNTAVEVFKKGIEKFTTVGLQSIKRCDSDLDTFVSKLKGIETDAHDVSRELNKMLVEAEKAEKMVESSKIDKLIKVLKSPFVKTYKSFEEAITSITSLVTEVKDGQKNAEKARKEISQLKDRIHNKVYTGAAIVIDIVALGAEVWGGNTKPEDFEKAKELVGIMQSGLEEIQDAYDDYFKKDK